MATTDALASPAPKRVRAAWAQVAIVLAVLAPFVVAAVLIANMVFAPDPMAGT